MSLGEKLKEVRKRFGLSQEALASILNVSRQAVTKWENDDGMPDISNLQELSKVFGLTVDYLVNNDDNLPALSICKVLDKDKYGNKLMSYKVILDEFFKDWDIYVLSVNRKLNLLEKIFDIFTGGDYYLIKNASDLSVFYLAVKANIKLLINIKDWTMKVYELPSSTNIKKFVYDDRRFLNCGLLKK